MRNGLCDPSERWENRLPRCNFCCGSASTKHRYGISSGVDSLPPQPRPKRKPSLGNILRSMTDWTSFSLFPFFNRAFCCLSVLLLSMSVYPHPFRNNLGSVNFELLSLSRKKTFSVKVCFFFPPPPHFSPFSFFVSLSFFFFLFYVFIYWPFLDVDILCNLDFFFFSEKKAKNHAMHQTAMRQQRGLFLYDEPAEKKKKKIGIAAVCDKMWYSQKLQMKLSPGNFKIDKHFAQNRYVLDYPFWFKWTRFLPSPWICLPGSSVIFGNHLPFAHKNTCMATPSCHPVAPWRKRTHPPEESKDLSQN